MPTLDGPSRREWLVASGVLIAATAILLREQLVAFTTVPDLGDPLFSMWRLGWVAHQLVHDPAHLFDANIFHPATRTLAYSDAMLVPALLVAPALWLGVPLAVAYTSLLLTSFVASGLAMFALARAVTGQAGAGLVAALFFAFDPFKIAHYSHLELQFTCWMPLASLYCLRTLTNGRWRDGLLTGTFVALQALSSLYYGAYLAASLVALSLAWMAFVARPRRQTLIALGSGACLAAVVAAAVTTPYRANRASIGERGIGEIEAYSARPGDYLRPHARSATYGHWPRDGEGAERELFPGTAALVLGAAALLTPTAPVLAPTLVALAVTVDASFGTNSGTYRALMRLPGFSAFRVPPRFRAVGGLYLAMLIAIGVAWLARLVRDRARQQMALSAVALLLLLDLRPSLGELQPVWRQAPPIYDLIPVSSAVVADMPLPGPGDAFWHDSVYMYFSTFHWHRLINGMSGFAPAHYGDLGRTARQFPSDEVLDVFAGLGTQYFVLHEGYYREDWARVVEAADDQPRLEFVALARWAEGESRLYRLK